MMIPNQSTGDDSGSSGGNDVNGGGDGGTHKSRIYSSSNGSISTTSSTSSSSSSSSSSNDSRSDVSMLSGDVFVRHQVSLSNGSLYTMLSPICEVMMIYHHQPTAFLFKNHHVQHGIGSHRFIYLNI